MAPSIGAIYFGGHADKALFNQSTSFSSDTRDFAIAFRRGTIGWRRKAASPVRETMVEGILNISVNQTKIAIVDDHPIVRCGLAKILQTEPDLRIVAEGSSATKAKEIATELEPDLMLLDLEIPGGGINALRAIRDAAPNVKCIIVTVCESTQMAMQVMNLGAKGYILKGASAREIKSAVRTVINDASFIAPEFAAKLLDAAQQRVATKSQPLGSREEQVLAELEHGLTNKQIAQKLKISERTVKHYMSIIMERYGVTNRVAALMEHKNSTSLQ